MKHVIRLSQRPDGVDVAEAEFDGQKFRVASRTGAEMGLARLLRDAGAVDGPWVGVDAQTGKERLYGRSMHRLATLTIQEGEKRPHVVKWTPHPMAEAAE